MEGKEVKRDWGGGHDRGEREEQTVIAEVSEKAQRQFWERQIFRGTREQSNQPPARGTQTQARRGSNVGNTGLSDTWPRASGSI